MKKFISITLFFACGILALFEQSKTKPNLYIMIPAIGVFMYGLFRIMSKIPDKKESEDENIE